MMHSINVSLCALLVVTSTICELFAADSDALLLETLVAETKRSIDRTTELRTARGGNGLAAWWQSGFLPADGELLSYDEAVARLTSSPLREDYAARREEAGDSSQELLHLANWCRDSGLLDREQAHLLQALFADTSLASEGLLKRAGFERVLGQWVHREQREQLAREVQRIESSLKKWRGRLPRIERQLRGSRLDQKRALGQLEEITDPDAVAAIDLFLGRSADVSVTRAAMQTLAQIDSYESSLVLAKYATFAPSPTVRREAAEYLKGRRLEDFVPSMLDLSATELDVRVIPPVRQPLAMAEAALEVILQRETDQHIQRMHSRVRLIPRAIGMTMGPARWGVIHTRRAENQAALELWLHNGLRRVDEFNELTAETNTRVGNALASVIGTSPTSDPRHWWAWWARWTEQPNLEAGEKIVFEVREDGGALDDPVILRHSCFAAGTPVWTETGLRLIEQIQIGDRVLSKNVETGELALRPVMRTSIRKAKPLITLQFGDETIHATGDHQLWVSGNGWVKARELHFGQFIHTVTGNAGVTSRRDGPTKQTFNLVVADDHTYFVGESGLLVQDLLIPAPTNMLVPGLSRSELRQFLSE